jgi:hypothetical protein
MKKSLALLLGLTVLLGCVAAIATDTNQGMLGKKTINFTAPTLVGGTLLPAGDYTVTHEKNGQTIVMIFTKAGGTLTAKSNCTLVPLKTKVPRSEQRYTINDKNEHVLTAMTFSGENVTHELTK